MRSKNRDEEDGRGENGDYPGLFFVGDLVLGFELEERLIMMIGCFIEVCKRRL